MRKVEDLVKDILNNKEYGKILGNQQVEDYVDTQLYQYEDYEQYKKNGLPANVYKRIKYSALDVLPRHIL